LVKEVLSSENRSREGRRRDHERGKTWTLNSVRLGRDVNVGRGPTAILQATGHAGADEGEPKGEQGEAHENIKPAVFLPYGFTDEENGRNTTRTRKKQMIIRKKEVQSELLLKRMPLFTGKKGKFGVTPPGKFEKNLNVKKGEQRTSKTGTKKRKSPISPIGTEGKVKTGETFLTWRTSK